jgi:hypothetical protein
MAQLDSSASESTTFDELLRPLEMTLETIENSRSIHHREVLSFTAFVRLLIYYFVKAPQSGRQLLTDTLSAVSSLGLAIVKRSTFFDAFDRFPVEWFVMLLTTVLTAVIWKAIPELDALGKLYCVDGSLFPALASMLWAEYKTNHAAIRLHLCFELNRMLPVQFIVDAGNSSEKDALRQMLEAGVTYIADRGYVCFQLLADIVNAQAHFVIRMKSNLAYTVTETLPVVLPEVVRHIFAQVSDRRVQLTGAKGNPIYRLVTFWVGTEQYLILTDRLNLTTFQVILLYAYRWQVELIFRFLKRTMNGLHLISTSKAGVTIQFYALLLAALLELRLKQACVTTYEASQQRSQEPVTETQTVPGLMVPPDTLASARGQTFLATVGEKLHRYWKISVHWLVHLRNLLAQPFDHRAIRLLACT